MDTAMAVLGWALPPLLGAIIGYVTNYIAIRMLFRPLTEKRIFGIRLPLTPGLIPRERGDLAESMARMVATELLTEEAVRKQIHAPSFQESVRTNITAITGELLDTTLGRVGDSFVPDAVTTTSDGTMGLLGSFSGLLSSAFSGFTKSESFALLVKDLIHHLVDEVSQKPVTSVLGTNRTLEGLVGGLLKGLNSERGRAEIRERVAFWVKQQFRENVDLSTYFTEDDIETVARVVDSVYPSLIRFFVRWLRSEGTKRELIVRGRFLVQDIVDRLNTFQRFIITAAQYQRTLDENMEGIVNDAVTTIEDAGMDPDSRRGVVDAVRRELKAIRERGLADVASKHEEAIERTAGTLAERAVGLVSGPEFQTQLLGMVSGSTDGETRTIGGLLDRLFGLEGGDPGDFIAGLVFPQKGSAQKPSGAATAGRSTQDADGGSIPAGGEIAETVRSFFRGFVAAHREMRIREFLGMDGETKERFDSALAGTLIATVDARVPEILASIDIHDLVVTKINGLNIEEVEGLLLRVIEKHLRWINIFGALLGALIGLIQDLLRVFSLTG